jgi:nucleoside phosphorylase
VSTLPLPAGKELAPSDVQCDGFYFPATVGGKSVICLKSNFHPKYELVAGHYGQAMEKFFAWLIKNNHFKYIISCGTSGGIWQVLDVGDVVVCSGVRFDPNDSKLIKSGDPATPFVSGVSDMAGSLTDGQNQFDIMTASLATYAREIIDTIDNVRVLGKGKAPKIYYGPLGSTQPNYNISDLSETDEKIDIVNKQYDTLGATFDNNDAFVAQACSAAKFDNWVSIRNISDMQTDPASVGDTYTRYQYCTTVIGVLAAYAFIVGH